MKYEVSANNKVIRGNITLDGSKSISNRALIIRALCKRKFKIHHLSTSEDTQALVKISGAIPAPYSRIPTFNAGHAGTTFRFLTALLSVTEGEWILTGSARMQQRPIGVLVDALRELGADINYLGKKNYPPLSIKGQPLTGKTLVVDSRISSQFISALFLIAPCLDKGLRIRLKGKVVSSSYLQMTLKIMEHFGILYTWRNNIIRVAQQDYRAKDFFVEADWSAASYYYAIAALSAKADIHLKGLKRNSWQGDAAITGLMKPFGVRTQFTRDGIRLIKNATPSLSRFQFDFTDCPDIVQTMMVACAGLNVNARASGITTLRIKETDRVAALQRELKKIGTQLKSNTTTIYLSASTKHRRFTLREHPHIITIDTYNDHRMAMSFAPLALIKDKIIINAPLVVKKSYSGFWNDLKKIGFKIRKVR